MIDRYEWRGGGEAMLRFGPSAGLLVAIVLPPFEEANRTRALMVNTARRMAAIGIGTVLPDLPGMGESMVPVGAVRLADWREALDAACASAGANAVASVRAAALIDTVADIRHWRLAPQDGPRLLRELVRTRIAGAREDGRDLKSDDVTAAGRTEGVELSGHWLSPKLFADLEGAAVPQHDDVRTVRLGGDAQLCDRLIDAAPPWRRAEPDADLALAGALACDLAEWLRP